MKKLASKWVFKALACVAVCGFSIQAQAIPYDFDASYNGGTISLDAGSDNPIGTVLMAGDTFNFNLQAVGDDFWKVDVANDFFPFNAFTTAETGTRTGTMALDLLLDGVSQFSQGPEGVSNGTVHVGTDTISLGAGLMFDEIILDYDLIASTTPTTTIIDYFIGGNVPGGFDDGISYNRGQTNPAPVPATVLLIGLGLMAIRLGRKTRPRPA